MRPRQLLYLALMTVLLVFALTAAWEFVLEGLLAPRHASNETSQEHWRYVLTATLAAAAAWAISGLVFLRIVARHDQVKRDLEEKETLSTQAAEMAHLGHYIWDERTDRHAYCSQEVAHLFGYTLEDYLPKFDDYDTILAEIHPDDRARYEAAWTDATDTRLPYDIEYRALTAKDGYRYFREQGRPVFEHGELIRWIGVIQDINESKRTEEALRRSEALYRETEHLAKLGNWEWDEIEDRCTYCSEELARLHGVSVAEYMRRTVSMDADLEWVHPSDRDRITRIAKDARDRQTGFDIEYRLLRDDGTALEVREVAVPVQDETGALVRSVGFVQDISERRQAEQALRQSERQLRVVTDNVPALISYLDRDLSFVSSPTTCRRSSPTWTGTCASASPTRSTLDGTASPSIRSPAVTCRMCSARNDSMRCGGASSWHCPVSGSSTRTRRISRMAGAGRFPRS
jgi:PAS domain S-box-containing protein